MFISRRALLDSFRHLSDKLELVKLPHSEKNIVRNNYSRKIVRKKFVLVFILLVISCVTILSIISSVDLYFLSWYEVENTSCHYSDVSDALARIGGSFNPPSKSIYFHETSCRGWLNSRQACAVESAARIHPGWQINLLFAGPVTEETLNNGSLKALEQFENVNFLRLHVVEYAKGTPLESMVSDGALNRTRWRISHTSDLLRYLTLYKWGGVYLDLDVVVVKSFEGLAKNWAARESDQAVAAGALSFSRDTLGRIVAEAAIRDFKAHYRGDLWGNNGPGVITRLLQDMCYTSRISLMSADTCKGFEVYGSELFYPVSWYNATQYFSPDELKVGDPYAYHVWNKLTQDFVVEKNSAYAKLAEKHCPTIYELYGDHFGL